MTEFFHMGGYGPYVWSAYGLTLAVLLFNLIQARPCMRRAKRPPAGHQGMRDSDAT